MTPIAVTVKLRTVSESNSRSDWRKKAKRVQEHRGVTRLSVLPQVNGKSLLAFDELVVTLVRIAPCKLDDDNLRGALKACRDGVADALDINDNDPRVEWLYGQERGLPRQYAVRVEMRAA